MSELARALLLHDYNTRVVLAGSVLLGVCSGITGTFMLLRKRALVGDVASHAALPGVALAYLIMERLSPGEGRWFPGLLAGAAITAALGLVTSQSLSRIPRIRDDAALALSLSLFFGLGVCLLTMIQGLPSGQSAGLADFIFGKAAALTASDVRLIAEAGFFVLLVIGMIYKELQLLCFDQELARTQGCPVKLVDGLLTAMVILVTVLGMQSVGLLLVAALLVLPPASARFWTDRLSSMMLIAGGLGGLAAGLGVLISASAPKLAAGAVIVLSATLLFVVSLLFGRARGVVWRWQIARQVRRQIDMDDLLRGIFERLEPALTAGSAYDDLTEHSLARGELACLRPWSRTHFERLLHEALNVDYLRYDSDGGFRLTKPGRRAALHAVKRHRLWEQYLIEHTAIDPGQVDLRADATEHWLHPEIVEELEQRWQTDRRLQGLPDSPHPSLPSSSPPPTMTPAGPSERGKAGDAS